MKHFGSVVRWVGAIGSVFVLTGCWGMLLNTSGYEVVDVSAEPAYWGGYESQAVYELQTDVFLQKKRGERPGTILVLSSPESFGKPRGGYWSSPPTIEAYGSDPGKWPDVQDIVSKGTLIRATSVEFWKDPVGGTAQVKAELLGGKFKGKTVYLSDLSNSSRGVEDREVFLDYPIEELLRKKT